MGAWNFVHVQAAPGSSRDRAELRHVAREASASPATGSATVHDREQAAAARRPPSRRARPRRRRHRCARRLASRSASVRGSQQRGEQRRPSERRRPLATSTPACMPSTNDWRAASAQLRDVEALGDRRARRRASSLIWVDGLGGAGWPATESTDCVTRRADEATLPMIATPSAPPTWRVVSFTAEPTPALRERERAHDRLGRRRHREAHARRHQHHAPDDVDVGGLGLDPGHRDQPGRHEREPARDDDLGAEPLDEPRAVGGARIIIVSANGSRRMPASSGEYPSTNWKYWVSRKIDAEHREEDQRDPPLAAVKRGFLKKREVEHRVVGASAPTRRTPASRRTADHERHRGRRVGPSLSGASMIP